MTTIKLILEPHPNSRRPEGDAKQVPYLEPTSVLWHVNLTVIWRSPLSHCKLIRTKVGTLIVATIYLQLIQN